ncbi:hypothetical protein FE257_007245 [Aspergillus nanangensis]|uniref:Uncharacterized protein n=1 Tax=Aspergillus nanangensis TaxID=2582783 RepID=A0AAD4CN05_ASPNN|nr:hypothetical protein FE257_007245 [Aspergillus nanangensis]
MTSTASCPFNPDELENLMLPSLQQTKTPRYLFRVHVHAPTSPEQTNQSKLVPPGYTDRNPSEMEDLFHQSYIATASVVNAHLQDYRCDENHCTLLTWTTSLLVAIIYGLNYYYYHHSTYNTTDKPSSLHTISIMVLDTHQLPTGTFVNARELMAFFAPGSVALQTLLDVERATDRCSARYVDEYLTQGVVDTAGVSSVRTSLQTMIDHGLFDLFPALASYCSGGGGGGSGELAEMIMKTRRLYNQFDDVAVQKRHVDGIIYLTGACFGGCWTVVVAVMLLAFKGRVVDNPVILGEFRIRFSGMFVIPGVSVFNSVWTLDWGLVLTELGFLVEEIMELSPLETIAGEGGPEIQRFRDLVMELHREFGIQSELPGNNWTLSLLP